MSEREERYNREKGKERLRERNSFAGLHQGQWKGILWVEERRE